MRTAAGSAQPTGRRLVTFNSTRKLRISHKIATNLNIFYPKLPATSIYKRIISIFSSLRSTTPAELETKLKLEKQRFEQLRQSLEREAREQTDLKDKSVQEINAKYESLQQQYKFLNSQLEDNKEDNTRDKAKQTKEMADLVAKVKSLQAQATDKDKSSAAWKVSFRRRSDTFRSLRSRFFAFLTGKSVRDGDFFSFVHFFAIFGNFW